MKTVPIQAAELRFDDAGRPWSDTYGDRYHPEAGAFQQAAYVFLAGNQLPQRWQQRPDQRFVILETGFGLGNNFLATWEAWRQTPAPRAPLDFVSLEKHPFTHTDLQRAHAHSPCPERVGELLEQWPVLTHDLHLLSFEGGQVRLLLALGDALAWLPELHMQVDAFYLDGFAPARNPALWQARVFKALARLAAPHATVATWSAARAVRDGLSTAGFQVKRAEGQAGKRHITLGHYAPHFVPRRPPRRAVGTPGPSHALIVGAGLAGCASAWGLAQVGWQSTVLDAARTPASGASGNPGGLFHGIVNGQDGVHARLYRAAALAAHKTVDHAIRHHGLRGRADGLWRLEWRRTVAEMQSLLDTLGLPPDYVQAHTAQSASTRCGWPCPAPAWFFPGGGWVDPRGLCHTYLAMAGEAARFRGEQSVASLRRDEQGWSALNADRQVIAQAPCLILTNAGDAQRLLQVPHWPLTRARGQISWCDTLAQAQTIGWPDNGPQQALAGTGYALPPHDSRWLFGATSQMHDPDHQVRMADHVANLMQWASLRGANWTLEEAQAHAEKLSLQGRVGWRWSTPDKLPIWGAVADRQSPKHESVRLAPRIPGLFVCTGLGSRGITWSALAGQVMASLVSDTPCPLPSSLLDAVDPARFAWPPG